jgi:hypothetical protein
LKKAYFFACKPLKTRGRKNQSSINSQLLPPVLEHGRDGHGTASVAATPRCTATQMLVVGYFEKSLVIGLP